MTDSPTSGSAVVHRAARTDWRSTAPMPIVQATSFTTLDAGFEHRLATRGAPMFLESLGHHLLPDAPSGTVSGLAEPAPHPVAPSPVQRSFAPSPGSVVPRMTTADPAVPAPPIDPVGLFTGRDEAADAPARHDRALIEALPPDLPPVRVPVVAPTRSDNVVDAPARPARADSDTDADAPSAPIVPLVTQRSLVDEAPSNPPSTAASPAGETALGDRPPLVPGGPEVPGGMATPARGAHSSSPVARIGEAIHARPVVQRDAETGAPGSGGPLGSPAATVSRLPSTSAGSSVAPTGDAGPAGVGAPIQRAMATESPPATTQPGTAARGTSEDVVGVALPLVGHEPLGAAPADAGVSPAGGLPAVTTSAATSVPPRRAVIGAPLEGGSPGPVVQATPDHDSSAAPRGHATLPTLGATPTVLGEAGATTPAPPAGVTTGPPAAAPDVAAVATVARSTTPPSSAPSSVDAGMGRTVAAPCPTRPLIAPANVESAHADVVGTGRVDSSAGPVVARSLASTDPGGSRPDRNLADGTSTLVVDLLATRPLSTTFDGPGATPDGPSRPSEPTSSIRSVGLTQSPLLSAGPATVQRAVTVGAGAAGSAGAQRTVAAAPAPAPGRPSPQLADRPATPRPIAFTMVDDQPSIEWEQDTSSPEAPTVQREAAPESGPDSSAPTPTGEATATTTTATATVGPAAPATPKAPRSEAELQELCRALYVPLRRRLCRDLLLDRERAGYRTDIRF